ncbi:hypothetical protein Tco_0494534 [Tanacetum coccineum]
MSIIPTKLTRITSVIGVVEVVSKDFENHRKNSDLDHKRMNFQLSKRKMNKIHRLTGLHTQYQSQCESDSDQEELSSFEIVPNPKRGLKAEPIPSWPHLSPPFLDDWSIENEADQVGTWTRWTFGVLTWSEEADNAPIALALMATSSTDSSNSKVLLPTTSTTISTFNALLVDLIYPRMDKRRPSISSYTIIKEETVESQAVLPQNVSIKRSAMITSKQTWRQNRGYLDSVNRDNGSYILKQFEYGNPEEDLKDYAIIDSGCSGSMTGDKNKLSDFKDYKG